MTEQKRYVSTAPASESDSDRVPLNIVRIIADDLGYGNLVTEQEVFDIRTWEDIDRVFSN